MSRSSRDNRSPPPTAARAEPFAHASIIVCVLLLAAVLLVFGQTVHHGFLKFDDETYVHENTFLTEGSIHDRIAWAFTTHYANNWHPLTWFSHILDCSIYGRERPGGHHATNVALHALATILLFLALRRLSGHFWASALAAALFAVHPLRVESVAWIAERKDVLSGLFFMLTLWAYAGYASRPFSWRRYFAVAAFFVLALSAKPTVVTLPLVLLLLDYWPLGRVRWGGKGTEAVFAGKPRGDEDRLGENLLRPPGFTSRECLRRSPVGLLVEKLPLVLLAGGSCVATVLAQSEGISAYVEVSLPWRIGNAAVAYVAYLTQFVCPINLAIVYPHPGTQLPLWKVAAAAVVLALITAGVVILRRRSPYLVTGWLWYLGMLVPMLGLVQVGWQARADRYTYLSQIGVCIMVAWGIRQAAATRAARWWASVGVLAALAILTTVAYRQTAFWCSDEILWKHALACTEKNYVAHLQVGMAMSALGQYAEALEQYRTAEKVGPEIYSKPAKENRALVATNLGVVLSKMDRYDEAIAEYHRALKFDPQAAGVHVNLAAVLGKAGRFDEAIAEGEMALKINPNHPMAHNNLGVALASKGRLVAAMSHYEKALELQPNYPEAQRNLISVRRLLEQTPTAIADWRTWIDLRPKDYAMIDNAAWLLATSGDAALRNGKDAIELAQRAARLVGPNEPTTLDTLAAAYAEAGRFADALQTARQALAAARQQGKPALVESIEERLRLYESHKPYHQPPPQH